ncbi:MAG: hypothetical protein ACLFQO_16965 [Cyclobacteriaceae bacterium]
MKQIVLCVFVIIMMAACQQQPQPQSLLRPPFAEVNLPVHEISFDAADGDTLSLADGSSIIVPPDAFILPGGAQARGEVRLVYREMRNARDILISGIPMKTKSGEGMLTLESAVMFELRAYQDTLELELDSLNRKRISTRIASNISDEDFDMYYLDEARRQWQRLRSVLPQENENAMEALMLALRADRHAEGMDLSNCFALNYVYYIDTWDRPRMKNFNYFSPRTAPRGKLLDRLMEEKLRSYKTHWVKGNPYKSKAEWMDEIHPAALMLWQAPQNDIPHWLNKIDDRIYVNVEEIDFDSMPDSLQTIVMYEGTYRLKFWRWTLDPGASASRREILHVMKAVPKFPLSLLFEDSPKEWSAEYERLREEAGKQRQIFESQGKVIRAFEIARMGVFNYDKPLQLEELIVDASFTLEGVEEPPFADVFVMVEGVNSVVRYSPGDWNQLSLYPGEKMLIFTVAEDNRIYTLSPERLESLDYQRLKLYNDTPRLSFKMQASSHVISSVDDVNQFLAEHTHALMALGN